MKFAKSHFTSLLCDWPTQWPRPPYAVGMAKRARHEERPSTHSLLWRGIRGELGGFPPTTWMSFLMVDDLAACTAAHRDLRRLVHAYVRHARHLLLPMDTLRVHGRLLENHCKQLQRLVLLEPRNRPLHHPDILRGLVALIDKQVAHCVGHSHPTHILLHRRTSCSKCESHPHN